MGLELKISGSPVRVGKMDATAYSGELTKQTSPVEFGRSERYLTRSWNKTFDPNIERNSLALLKWRFMLTLGR